MSHKHLSCDKTLSKDAEVIYMYVESHGVPILYILLTTKSHKYYTLNRGRFSSFLFIVLLNVTH